MSTTLPDSNGQLGQIVSWKVPSQVSLDTLRTALRSAGLDSDLAQDMTALNAMKRALHDMRAGRVIDKLRHEGERYYFQFTRKYLDEHGIAVQFDREAEVWLGCDSGWIGGDVPEIVAEAQRLLDEHRAKRLTIDLTRLVQKVFDSHKAELVAIRDQGGAYFVPQSHEYLVSSTRDLLTAIGGSLRSFAVRLGCADTAESVAESFAEHMTELIGAFRESIANVGPDSNKGVAERREGRIVELRQKLSCYRGLLGAYADRIGVEIDAADAELLARITAPVA